MNNSNPLVPQGSLLEQKNKRRARVKVAVFSILAFHVVLISPLLIQGCKREQPAAQQDASTPSTNDVAMDTNAVTQLPPVPVPGTNTVQVPPTAEQANAPAPAAVTAGATEYVVTKGDSFYSISKKLGVSMKAIQDANPGVVPTRLKLGQKLQIPAATTPVSNASLSGGAVSPAMASDAGEVYTVKSGDSLAKIAKTHGTSVKALRAANDLKTTVIKVGQKLKLPAKSAAPTAPAEVVPTATTAAVSNPLPVPGSPAPANSR